LNSSVQEQEGNTQMKTLALAVAGVLMAGTAALAQQPTGQGGLMTSIPANNRTVTDWYKQNVYDPQQ
jgi:hypothetical protein